MSCARSLIAVSCSSGGIPSAPASAFRLATSCLSPATRTMKNSSRFEATMDWNLSRSPRGSAGSTASSSTRSLNSSQESSRFRNRLAEPGSRRPDGWAETALSLRGDM